MAGGITVAWGVRASKQFRKALLYIKEYSPQNAEKFRLKILERTEYFSKYPESGGLEKYKIPNDGSYRYFTKYHYRISYRVIKSGIKIIRIRHTKQKPAWI